MKTKAFLTELDHQRIVKAIEEAEARTSAEIRVFVSHAKVRDAVEAAKKQFMQLEMHRTRLRNGVLIFVAPRSNAYAVVGDWGIHSRCGDALWNEVVERVGPLFREREFTGGIVKAVQRVGEVMEREFPRLREGDVNELGDEVGEG